MNLVIRSAVHSDFLALKSLGAELQEYERKIYPNRAKASDIVDQYSVILQREFAKGEYFIFVAEVDGKLVGYTSGCPNDPEEDIIDTSISFHIDDLVVTSSLRGQGIGKKLLDHIADYAKEKGYTSIELNVLAANTEAQQFYRGQGFDDYELVLRKNI